MQFFKNTISFTWIFGVILFFISANLDAQCTFGSPGTGSSLNTNFFASVIGQTFQAGCNGRLNTIEIYGGANTVSVSNMLIEVYDADLGGGGSVIASESFVLNPIGVPTIVTLGALPELTNGSTYRFEVSNDLTLPFGLSRRTTTSADTYTQGIAFTVGLFGANPFPGDLTFSVNLLDPLPVELLYFRGDAKGEEVGLDWATSLELNNEGFEIERSADGQAWEQLGFVPGHGTTELEQYYRYTDVKPYPGLNYYRLKQVDFDGAYEYSDVVKVDVAKEGKMEVYPNPTNGEFWVKLPPTLNTSLANLQVYDETGRLVWKDQFPANAGRVPVSLPAELSAGYYLVTVQTGNEVFRTNLVKQ